MATIGHARVSAREGQQVFDGQRDALRAAGRERVCDDRGSGAGSHWPGLSACLDCLRRGDVPVVLGLDRLAGAGRAIRRVDEPESRSAGFRVPDTAFDTRTPTGRAYLQIQAAFAEMERDLVRQRASEGVAPARGRKGGRPQVVTPGRLRHAQRPMADRTRGVPTPCRGLGETPASTLHHCLRAHGPLKALGRALLGA